MICVYCKNPIVGPRQIANGQDTGACGGCIEHIEKRLRDLASRPPRRYDHCAHPAHLNEDYCDEPSRCIWPSTWRK